MCPSRRSILLAGSIVLLSSASLILYSLAASSIAAFSSAASMYLRRARAQLIEQRRASVQVLADIYDRGRTEQARERFIREPALPMSALAYLSADSQDAAPIT